MTKEFLVKEPEYSWRTKGEGGGFENGKMESMCEARRDEVTGRWRKLQTEELRNL